MVWGGFGVWVLGLGFSFLLQLCAFFMRMYTIPAYLCKHLCMWRVNMYACIEVCHRRQLELDDYYMFVQVVEHMLLWTMKPSNQ